MSRRLSIMIFVTFVASPTAAQAGWTLAPTVSFGYGWADGQYDYVGDEPYCEDLPEPLEPAQAFNAFQTSMLTCWAPVRHVAPYGSAGITLVGALSSRFAFTGALDLAVGGTHRIVDGWANSGYVVVVGEGFYAIPDVELAYRVASTGRLRLGARRAGYLGAGARLGYRMGVGDMNVPRRAPSPDGNAPNIRTPRGSTAEALVEAGTQLGPVTLGVLVGAGRPRFRAELVMSIPIALGEP